MTEHTITTEIEAGQHLVLLPGRVEIGYVVQTKGGTWLAFPYGVKLDGDEPLPAFRTKAQAVEHVAEHGR